jgi:integrase
MRLIDLASNLFHRAMLMKLYSTGMRRAELCHLQVADIDSVRMVIHIRHGKRNRNRDVPLSPKLLDTLREYWCWMQHKTCLFPGSEKIGESINRLHSKCTGKLAGKRRKLRAPLKTFAPIYWP